MLPLAALVAAVAAIATVRQRTRADASDEWWKRVQFALEKADSEDIRTQDVGTAMLEHLTDNTKIAYKPWTWRNRWRVTKRDMEMISAALSYESFPQDGQEDPLLKKFRR